jgi:hypothetical protein
VGVSKQTPAFAGVSLTEKSLRDFDGSNDKMCKTKLLIFTIEILYTFSKKLIIFF